MVTLDEIKKLGWTPYYKDRGTTRLVKGKNLYILTHHWDGNIFLQRFNEHTVSSNKFTTVWSGKPENIVVLQNVLNDFELLGTHIIKT